jgi:folate-binding protein YgfZ
MTDTPSAGYEALRSSMAAAFIDRDVVLVEGPDAEPYLQGQLSADVAGLAAGASTWTWLLQPAGKVEVLARVSRIDRERFALDTDPGWGEALEARLARFKLRSKLELSRPGWKAVALRGPDARPPAPDPDHPVDPTPTSGTVVVADASWPGLVGHDLLGPDPLVPAGAVSVTAEELEVAGVEAGIPRMGRELDERTIPAETGLVERTVSFTKGCYTGQELVARIDSRGSNVARHLRGLVLDGAVEEGAELTVDGKTVGVVTSVVTSPVLGPVALAYVRRAVEPGRTVDAGGVTAEVRTLPLVS